jgi:Mg-chelatase subunit ChlD
VLLALLIADEHRAVRRAAIEAARDRRIIEAVPQLIARMEQDSPRVRALALESLVELTGLDHGPTTVRWRAWWEAEAGTFELPARQAALAAARQRQARKAAAPTVAKQATFYGVRFATDHVIFVLDISGSMDNAGRLERMQRETLAALDEIEDDAQFNLVFFETSVRPWGQRMVKMTARNRALARQAVSELRALGGTNLHGGLGVAFADPDVETIVILSDGEPSEGVTGTESILRDVRRWNEMRGIVVHSVAVGWKSELLESLSAQSGGEATTAF